MLLRDAVPAPGTLIRIRIGLETLRVRNTALGLANRYPVIATSVENP